MIGISKVLRGCVRCILMFCVIFFAYGNKLERNRPILLYVSWIVMLVNEGPLERMIGVQSLYEEHK